MKILFLATWYPYPPDNGSKIRSYHLLRALGCRHEVTLLSFAFDTAAPSLAEPLRSFCADIQTIWRNPFEENRTSSLRRFLSTRPAFTRPVPEMSQLVRTIVARTDFSVVIASTGTMATYALQHLGLTGKVLEEHNSLTRMMWDRYCAQTSPGQRLRCLVSWQKTRRYEARVFRQFDLVTMVSEQDRQFSEHRLPGYRGWIEVIPNGVDCTHNHPSQEPAAGNSLVFNGALTYSANLDAMRYFLAEVYPLIRREVPGISLTITGSLEGVDLSGLYLDKSVHLSGYVEDVRPLVGGARACVVPIRQGGGSRLKILEAMALGTPVVATTKGAEGLEVTSGQDILTANEPEAFAAKVVRLLREPGLRQRLSGNARRLVEQRYDWAQIGHRFVDLVEAVGLSRGRT